jgi:hypothetical protein
VWKVELVDARLVRRRPSRMVVDQPKAGVRDDEFDTGAIRLVTHGTATFPDACQTGGTTRCCRWE